MGIPQTPSEAAPAYDEVWNDHPVVNGIPPSGSTSAYTPLPQSDLELATSHTCTQPERSTSAPPPSGPSESLAQTIAGVFRPKPHVHCKECDVLTTARERRANERHCCVMVASTFMVAFACLTLIAILVFSLKARQMREGRGH